MGNGPIEEKDAGGAQQGTHQIDHAGYLRGVAGEMGEEIGYQHEERSSRRMPYFQFVTCGDKLGTVPETDCRLYRGAIGEGGDRESHPSQDIVHQSVLSHSVM